MAKDTSAPIFVSTETESKFILTSHLKGFGKEHIGIKINEDGTQIAVRLEKTVQEMVMSRWMVHKKEAELKEFIRAFQIPSGVNLDGIKAKFDEQKSILTILLPKLAKGIRGVKIEEVKEDGDICNKVEEACHVKEKTVDAEMSKKEIGEEILEKVVAGEKTICEDAEDPKQGTTQMTTKSVIEEETRIGERAEMEAKEQVVLSDKEPKREDLKENVISQDHDVKTSEATKDREKTNSQKEEYEAKEEVYYKEPSIIRPNEETMQERKLVMPQSKEPSEESNELPTQQIQKPKLVESGDFGFEGSGSSTLDQIVEKRKSFDMLERVEEELLEDSEAMTCSTKHESDGLPEQYLEECHDNIIVHEEKDGTTKVGEEHGDQVKEASSVDESCKKEDNDQEKKQKKSDLRKVMLCKPCVIAGSSILVSLVLIAIHWIRSRKRQVQ